MACLHPSITKRRGNYRTLTRLAAAPACELKGAAGQGYRVRRGFYQIYQRFGF